LAAVSLLPRQEVISLEQIVHYFESLLPDGITLELAVQTLLIICCGALFLSLLGRAVGGKKSDFNRCVSCAIGIIFIYVLTILILSMELSDFAFFVNPLPFVSISDHILRFFQFRGAELPVISAQVLDMVILAFLVNLLDSIMPRGKHIVTWYFFRCITIVLSMGAQTLVNLLLTVLIPEGLAMYAPMIMLGILVFLLFMGVLKILLGVLLLAVNPLIAAVYAFFFSHRIGKMISKAVLSTVILCTLIFILGEIGLTAIVISSDALVSYVPILVGLLIVWYLVGHVL
jgi:hypothetical protein